MRNDKEAVKVQVGESAPMSDSRDGGSLVKATNDSNAGTRHAHIAGEPMRLTLEAAIPRSISSMTEYKRKFSFWDMYRSFACIPRAIPGLVANRKSKLVDPDLVKRIQLAVTEVNGSPVALHERVTMALREGMSSEEISSLLGEAHGNIKPREAKAIVFAQHFAQSQGHAKEDAYEAIVKEYGEKEARIMLSVAQVTIARKMYGIPYSAFRERRKGKPFKDSSLFFELGTLISGVLSLPFAFVHGLLRGTFDLPNERLDWKDQVRTPSGQQ